MKSWIWVCCSEKPNEKKSVYYLGLQFFETSVLNSLLLANFLHWLIVSILWSLGCFMSLSIFTSFFAALLILLLLFYIRLIGVWRDLEPLIVRFEVPKHVVGYCDYCQNGILNFCCWDVDFLNYWCQPNYLDYL